MSTGPLILLASSIIGGAFVPTFVKLGTQEFPPLIFSFGRFFVATLLFLPFFLKNYEKVSRNDIKLLMFQGLFLSLNVGFYAIGIQSTSIIISQILYTFMPIMVGVIAWIFLKERFTKEKILGGGAAFLGVCFLLFQSTNTGFENTYGTPMGNVIVLCAVFSWSIYLVLSKKLTGTYKPSTVSFYGMLMVTIVLFFMAIGEFFLFPSSIHSISNIGLISLFVTGISTAAFIILLQIGTKKTTAFTASLFSYLGPFFASITSVPIFHERISFNLVFGGVVILAGVFYATSSQQVHKLRRHFKKK